MFRWFRNKNNINETVDIKDSLIFHKTYLYGEYSDKTKYKKMDIEDIVSNYRNLSFNEILILSKMNGYHYPFFDMDDLSKYEHFKTNTESNYVSFQSSPGHFWVIVDEPYKTINEFRKSDLYTEWITYSDYSYVGLTVDKSNQESQKKEATSLRILKNLFPI